MRETASGLAFLHSNGYMHRDVKSTNILLDGNHHAKVADFGVAKLYQMQAPTLGADAVTRDCRATGTPLDSGVSHTVNQGTYRYMAPEVANVLTDDADPRASPTLQLDYNQSCDVYSFGLLMWEVLHQALPFGHLGALAACRAAIASERPPIKLAEEREPFTPLITACWSQCPAHRPTMAHVVEQLLCIEDVGEASDNADQPVAWPRRPVRRRPNRSGTAKLGGDVSFLPCAM